MPKIESGGLPAAKPRRRVRPSKKAEPVEDREVTPLHEQQTFEPGVDFVPDPDIESLPQLEPPPRVSRAFLTAAQLVAREQLELLDEGDDRAAAVLGGVIARLVLEQL